MEHLNESVEVSGEKPGLAYLEFTNLTQIKDFTLRGSGGCHEQQKQVTPSPWSVRGDPSFREQPVA